MSEVRVLRPEEYAAWDELVANSPYGSVFDETRWLSAAADASGAEIEILGVFDAGELVGGAVFALRQEKGFPTGRLPPLCHTNTCLVKALPGASPAKRQAVDLEVADALAAFAEQRYSLAVVTNQPAMLDIRGFRWRGWRTNILYTYLIDLTSWTESCMSRSKRRAVRHAARKGLAVDEEPDSQAVYELLCKTGERHGIPTCVDAGGLETLRRRLGDAVLVRTAVIESDDRPVAGILSLADDARGAAYALLAGFDPEYADLRASAFLQWVEIEYWKARGMKVLDLVGADVRSNSAFKAEFGGRLTPYFQVSYVRTAHRILNALLRR